MKSKQELHTEELKVELQKLEIFFLEAPALMLLLQGPDYIIEKANPAAVKFFNYRDILNKPLFQEVPEIQNQGFKQLMDQVLETGTPYFGTEMKALIESEIAGEMKEYFFDFSYKRINDNNGKPYGIYIHSTDVTNKVHAREKIRLAEAQFKTMANSIPQLAWMADPNGHIFWYNQRWYDFTGTTLEQMKGWGWMSVPHPDYLDQVLKKITDFWNGGWKVSETWEDTIPMRGADGNYRWFLSRMQPIKDEAGQVIQWFGTNTDITEQKITASKLASETEKLEIIISQSPAGIGVMRGPDFVFERVNTEWCSLVSPRDYLNRPHAEVYPELHNSGIHLYLKKTFETGETFVAKEMKFLVEVAPKILDYRYYDFSYIRLGNGIEEPYGIFAHAMDVTAQVLSRKRVEESEDALNLALTSGNIGFWNWDATSGYVRLSKTLMVDWGIDPDKFNNTFEEYLERIHVEDRYWFSSKIKKSTFQTESYDIEFRVVKPSGELIWVNAKGQCFADEQKNPKRMTGITINTTERKQAAKELQLLKEQAEAANYLKSSFLANMSHEIRTPLGVITGFVDLLRSSNISPSDSESYMLAIERNSQQLLRLIDDILDLSKVEAGKLVVEKVEFSLIDILSDIKSTMAFKAKEKGLSFHLKLTENTPEWLISDPIRIRQILLNLVTNSIKFTETGSINVTVGFQFDKLTLEVEDTGCGLTKDQSEKLFQPFSQADASITRKYGGTGLGLALSKRLTEALDGTLRLSHYQLGKGCTFVAEVKATLSTRIHMQSNSQESKNLSSRLTFDPAQPVPPGRLTNIKILLVEDSLDNQFLIKRILEREGATLEIASDGIEGVEKATALNPDIILMDIQMPQMDGYTALKILRDQGFSNPIIALTAHAMAEERKKSFEAGCDAHLTKPIQKEILIQEILKCKNAYPSLEI